MSAGDPRVATVNEHMRLENAHDFPACAAVFSRPRYEVLADGSTYDGTAAVEGFLGGNKLAFPDFHYEPTRISAGPDNVVVEGRFHGTQNGPWRGLPATGRKVDFPMCLIFEFEGEDMVNEIVYMDLGTALGQLGVAFNPNGLRFKLVTALSHPVTLTKAMVRTVVRKLTGRGK